MGIERMNHEGYYEMLRENLEYFRSIEPFFTSENAHLAETV